MRRTTRLLALLLAMSLLASAPAFAQSGEIPRISPQELKSWMDQGRDFVLLDVRPQMQWEQSEQEIRGAEYENPNQAREWASKYSKEKPVVLY
jgi:rhodanese-related sulfurtransferase